MQPHFPQRSDGPAPAGPRPVADCRFGRIEDARLFGRALPRRITVDLLPDMAETGNGFLLACQLADDSRRLEARISISFQRAQLWHEGAGPEVLALLAEMRRAGPVGSDTPVLRMAFEGVDLDRTLMSERGRKYRIAVFEAARWFYRRDGRPVTGGRAIQG